MTNVVYKAITKGQLSEAYNVSIRTMRLWLEPIEEEVGEYVGRSYKPKQIQTIVEFLGVPENPELVIGTKKVKV